MVEQCKALLALHRRLRAALAPKPALQILKGVSGQAFCGELVGILGPSGSGKTTLLSILANSTTALSSSSKISGKISINGHAPGHLQNRSVAYVPQNDYLLPSLTVRETLWFSCQLRLPPNTSARAIKERVNAVMEELGLFEIADRHVGGSGSFRGISGGQRRRVSIGTEMVTNASLLLLDEPTSGLDSVTASKLLRSLQQMARASRIIMLSLHQPSPTMFSLLDKCLLVVQGTIAFDGHPSEAEPFFLSAGLPCPERQDIAEHLLETATDPVLLDCLLEFVDQNGPSFKGGCELPRWIPSHQKRAPQEALDASPTVPLLRPKCASLFKELAALSWRTFTDVWRSPNLLLMHLVVAAAMGIGVGVMFRNLTLDIAGAQGRLGIVFFTLCLIALTSLTTVDLMTNERGLAVREIQAGYYRPITYYLSKATFDAIFLRVLPTIIYIIPVYSMAKLQGGVEHISLFACVATGFAVAVGALSMAVTVGFDSAGKASLVMNLILLVQLLFAGYFKDLEGITPALRWIRYLSPFYYAFESLVVHEISGLAFEFTAAPGVSAGLNGDAFLSAVHLRKENLLTNTVLLDALYSVFLLLGISLLYLTIPRRPRWV